MAKITNALQPGTVLHGGAYDYRIIKALGQGSFGITYQAALAVRGPLGTINTDVNVAIKEFFMREINSRDGETVTAGSRDGLYGSYRRKFVQEARNLSRLQHNNIIKVVESFEANGTDYYVMEYIDEGNLESLIGKEGLPAEQVRQLSTEIGHALEHMHAANMLHLDLKPANIMIRDGHAVLIDFGLSKQFDDEGRAESTTNVGAGTPGYSPIEQMSRDPKAGGRMPVTMDIYAFGATMFKMVTGQRPPEAYFIFSDGFPESELTAFPAGRSLRDVIVRAMDPRPSLRYQSVNEMIQAITHSHTDSGETTEFRKRRPDVDNEETEISTAPTWPLYPPEIHNTFRIPAHADSVTVHYSPWYIGMFSPGTPTMLTFTLEQSNPLFKKFISEINGMGIRLCKPRRCEDYASEICPGEILIEYPGNTGDMNCRAFMEGDDYHHGGNIDIEFPTLEAVVLRYIKLLNTGAGWKKLPVSIMEKVLRLGDVLRGEHGSYRIRSVFYTSQTKVAFHAYSTNPADKNHYVVKEFCLTQWRDCDNAPWYAEAMHAFAQQARALAKLSIRGFAKIVDVIEKPGKVYVVQKFARGRNLVQIVESGELERFYKGRFAYDTIPAIAGTLALMHSQGVCHLGLTPESIVVDDYGKATIVDFGINVLADEGESSTHPVIIGSPVYTPFDQNFSRSVQDLKKADVYSFGAVMYYMFKGHDPKSPRERMENPHMDFSGIYSDFDYICMRCMDMNPALRWPDMAAVRDAIWKTFPAD